VDKWPRLRPIGPLSPTGPIGLIRLIGRLSLLVAPLLCLPIPTLAQTTTTSPIELNVLNYGARAVEDFDNTSAFQRALDAAAAIGGGTVYAPAGRYHFQGHLTLPAYVTLRGTAHAPPTTSDSSSTLLLVHGGHDNENAEPFLQLNRCSTIRGFQVFYPRQRPKSIVPYPWCVRGHGDNIAIRDVLLINPYKAVDFGTFPCGRHLIDCLYAHALKTGLFIDKCLDVGRVQNVHFWPFWTEEAMAFTRENGTAFILAKTDWQFMRDCFTIAYKVGFHFTEVESGPGNAVLTQCGADIGPVAVLVDAVQRHSGVSFSNCQMMAGVIVKDSNQGPVKFTSSGFWGVEGVTGSHAEIAGAGHVTFNGCHFAWWDQHRNGAPAIVAQGGGVTITGCEFLDEKPTTKHVRLGEDVEVAIITSNRFRAPSVIESVSEGDVIISDNASGKKRRLFAALDELDADAVADVWKERLEKGSVTSQSVALRLASAVVLGSKHAAIRKQLLESVITTGAGAGDEPQEGGAATRAFVERARRELQLDVAGGEVANIQPSLVAIPRVSEVTIDGQLNDAAWRDVPLAQMAIGDGADSPKMHMGFVYDEEALYLSARLDEPRIGQLKAKVATHDGPLWTDDALELFLAPARVTHRYLQMIVNPNGAWYDGIGTLRVTDSSLWETKPQIATALGDDYWTIELRLTWKDIGLQPQPGDVWGLDLRRWRFAGEQGTYKSWSNSPIGGDTHRPESFGFLQFQK